MSTPEALDLAAQRLARSERLIVASDFDGTLAPLVPRPPDARMVDLAAGALGTLAACPGTTVAILSGRDLRSLRAVCPQIPGVILVGSYGAEWPGAAGSLGDSQRETLDSLVVRLEQAASAFPGAFVEHKTLGAAFHARGVDPTLATEALDRAHAAAASLSGLTRHLGRGIVEWSLFPTRKGDALEMLRREHGPAITVALGDDEPDLEAFDRLDHADARLYVSPSAHPGTLWVPTPDRAARWLADLADLRAGRAARPPRRVSNSEAR